MAFNSNIDPRLLALSTQNGSGQTTNDNSATDIQAVVPSDTTPVVPQSGHPDTDTAIASANDTDAAAATVPFNAPTNSNDFDDEEWEQWFRATLAGADVDDDNDGSMPADIFANSAHLGYEPGEEERLLDPSQLPCPDDDAAFQALSDFPDPLGEDDLPFSAPADPTNTDTDILSPGAVYPSGHAVPSGAYPTAAASSSSGHQVGVAPPGSAFSPGYAPSGPAFGNGNANAYAYAPVAHTNADTSSVPPFGWAYANMNTSMNTNASANPPLGPAPADTNPYSSFAWAPQDTTAYVPYGFAPPNTHMSSSFGPGPAQQNTNTQSSFGLGHANMGTNTNTYPSPGPAQPNTITHTSFGHAHATGYRPLAPAPSTNNRPSLGYNYSYYTAGSGGGGAAAAYDSNNADSSAQPQRYTYPEPGGGYNSPLPASSGPVSPGLVSSGLLSPGPAAAAPPSRRRRGRAGKAATSGSVSPGPVAGSAAAAAAAAPAPSRRRGGARPRRAANSRSGSVSSRSASPAARRPASRRRRGPATVSSGSVSAAAAAPTAADAAGAQRRVPSILDHPDPWACPICFHCCCTASSVKTHLLEKHPELQLTRKSLEADPQFSNVRPLSYYRGLGLDVTYRGNDRKQVNARRRMDAGIKTDDVGYLDNVYKYTPAERKAGQGP